jgi:TPP-dependent 2-oxoacid decarboxylase
MSRFNYFPPDFERKLTAPFDVYFPHFALCAVVTYMVGGLSVINAVAGAYSDDIPLLCISGGPNTHDSADRHLLHHTIGETELYQSSMCFKPVTAESLVIRHLKDAPGMIDRAILTALNLKKPVYLEIPCNLVPQPISIPSPLSSVYFRKISDSVSLTAAAADIIERITHAVKPCLVAGPKLLTAEAILEFGQLANAIGCGVAILPNAKSFFSESHPQFMGTYWGGISSPHVREIVESCDLIIIVGGLLNDYVTVGWTALLPEKKVVDIQATEVTVCKRLYSAVNMADLLTAVARQAPVKDSSLTGFLRYKVYEGEAPPIAPADPSQALTVREVKRQLQEVLSPDTDLIVETGDSWFIGQYLKLPEGAKYHWQMQYARIVLIFLLQGLESPFLLPYID